MKIGLDLDGVVIDSEKTIRTYLEIYAIEKLNGAAIVNYDEPKMYSRYNFTKEQQEEFIQKYLLQCSKESSLMAGFKPVYQRLKDAGHEFVVITARGGYNQDMKTDAIRIISEANLDKEIEKFYWHTSDKLETCQKENVDIMIDDDWQVIDKLSKNGIKTLYFRDTNMKKLPESEYVKEVNNWGDIYRVIVDMCK